MCLNECEEKLLRVKILFLDLLLICIILTNHLYIQSADVFILSPCAMEHDLYLKHFEVLAKICHENREYFHD